MEVETLRDPDMSLTELQVPSEGQDQTDLEQVSVMQTRRRDEKNSIKSPTSSDENDDLIKEPKSRKRTSKTSSKKPEDRKQSKAKCQAKERAQKSRDRKKRYTEELEDKVNILEKQVKYLTLELDKYKKIELKHEVDSSEHSKNIKEETTILEEILDHLQNNNNMDVFKKAHTVICDKEGFKGENRFKTLDRAFDVIVDFLIPDTFALVFYFLQSRDPNSTYCDYEKIRKINNRSKYQIQEMLDRDEIDDCDLHWHAMNITHYQAEFINSKLTILLEGKKRAKDILIRLNQLRNDIRENGKALSEYPTHILSVLKHEQLLAGYENVCRIRAKNKFTLDQMFGFPSKASGGMPAQDPSTVTSSHDHPCVLESYIFD